MNDEKHDATCLCKRCLGETEPPPAEPPTTLSGEQWLWDHRWSNEDHHRRKLSTQSLGEFCKTSDILNEFMRESVSRPSAPAPSGEPQVDLREAAKWRVTHENEFIREINGERAFDYDEMLAAS